MLIISIKDQLFSINFIINLITKNQSNQLKDKLIVLTLNSGSNGKINKRTKSKHSLDTYTRAKTRKQVNKVHIPVNIPDIRFGF